MKQLILSAFLIFSFIGANAQTAGTLTVKVTTSSAGGGYANQNVEAIWIQDNTGKLVNTMLYYTKNSNSSATDLTVWYGLIGSWANRSVAVTTDGITGATAGSYGLRTCYWGKTASVSGVADGTYTVKMELADEGSPSVAVGSTGHKMVAYTFVKGSASSTGVISGSPASCFSGISISWVPVNTAVQNVELEKLYSVYPNPAISNIYVSGNDVNEVEICSISGRSLIVSREQNVNVSSLPKGAYLAVIKAKNGTVVKKILKM